MSSGDPLSRLGNVASATRAIADEVVKAAHAAGYPVTVVWGMGGGEHATGKALDFMVSHAGAKITNPRAAGDWIAQYLWDHKDRLGLIHMIWRQRIKSTDPRYSPGQWVWMADRGTPTENHMDHIHAWFDDTYQPPTPPPIQEDEMIVISCAKRGIAVVGPGYWYPVPTDAHVHAAIRLCFGKVLETADPAEFDRWREIAAGGVSSRTSDADAIMAAIKDAALAAGITDEALDKITAAVTRVTAADVAAQLEVKPR